MSKSPLPLAGWRPRREFIAAHPELRVVLPSPTSLDWALRSHRSALARFLAKRGRDTLIHDEAASVLAELLLRPEAA
jgi:hypothetical protein